MISRYTARCEPANPEQACRMVTLTRDFHVFAPGATARLSAILIPILHIAEAWDARTSLSRFIRQHNLFSPVHVSDHCSVAILGTLHADLQTVIAYDKEVSRCLDAGFRVHGVGGVIGPSGFGQS